MIELVQVRNFRMLRANSVALQPFHVLVGENATGKSTFLGALQFLSDVVKGGVKSAVEAVGATFYDLCFSADQAIELAVELTLPYQPAGAPPRRGKGRGPLLPPFTLEGRVRYEIEVGIGGDDELRVLRENLFILHGHSGFVSQLQGSLSGNAADSLQVIHRRAPPSWRKVVGKTREGRDYFRHESTDWNEVFRFGPDRPALGSLPEDPDRFPLSIETRNAIRDGVRTLSLDAQEMRSSSPPGRPTKLALDGSNLPQVVRELQARDPVLFAQWVAHVAQAVIGLETVSVSERKEDRHLVLEAQFAGDRRSPVPSWMLSDGTLRLMALTLLSYASSADDLDVYLVEEPENGLHPLAIQTVFQALSQPAPNSQFLCATHSPIFLAETTLDQALVFRRAAPGYSIVRRGSEIPELKDWTERVYLPDLFVTGVLS